jgi:hypothetical protein
VVCPYKKPESEAPENTPFNNQVSMLRIRSEHAIGFLKGRFQSLKGLRVSINDEKSHKYATYWAMCCISLHNVAMAHEAASKSHGSDSNSDPFVLEGLSSSGSDSAPENVSTQRQAPAVAGSGSRTATLAAARAHREELKHQLFAARERRKARRQGFFQLSSTSSSGQIDSSD